MMTWAISPLTKDNIMSRYIATDGQSQIAYGFDDCGLPGYFLSDALGGEFDTRPFMCDTDEDGESYGTVMSRGKMVEWLHEAKKKGFNIPQDHINSMVMDLPF